MTPIPPHLTPYLDLYSPFSPYGTASQDSNTQTTNSGSGSKGESASGESERSPRERSRSRDREEDYTGQPTSFTPVGFKEPAEGGRESSLTTEITRVDEWESSESPRETVEESSWAPEGKENPDEAYVIQPDPNKAIDKSYRPGL